MSSFTTSAFFEAKYRRAADPWNFATSPYELNRYARILASLRPRTFSSALEAGCSIGVLTSQLAAVCEHLHALDVSVTAATQARERCRHLPNVHIRVGSLLTDVPPISYDLVVLSEIGYYFERAELANIASQLSARLAPGGLLLGAHWLGHSPHHLLTGDQVHEVISNLPSLQTVFSERHGSYRINHWIKQ